jgi:hypothetical protein
MSVFKKVTIPCPSCSADVEFNAVLSVNADRRPDLRDAIMEGSFQRQACPKCSTEFRLDPEFTYVDVGRGQWIAAFPASKLDQWKELEVRARATFDKSYGAKASAAAREIGADLKPRLTFGWAGIGEKLVAVENGFDDVIVELAKTAMVRGLDKPPVGPGTELRLTGVSGDKLVIAWLDLGDETAKEILQVPRSLYDDIAADLSGWEGLEAELSSGPFVDMNRLLVAAN